MAVNLSKNGTELMAAYKDVLDGKTRTNWALFTYEGNSQDIRLAEKGDGGLEEMVEEFNSGKVMYAFCRVEDPNSGLPKYVLINWTGEGVNSSRKGICANHLSTMASFLKGAHVTINARDEDDVEPKVILDKVAKASGASFNFHKHKQAAYVDVPRRNVGSVYRKVNAVEEIQQINKDDFWIKTQEDEEMRKREEIKRAELERQQLERERRGMEEQQSRERERRAKERAKERAEQEKMNLKLREQEERERELQQRNLDLKEEKRTGSSRTASVQKANEAKSLISQRSFDPRDIFKQREQSLEANNKINPADSTPGKLLSPFFSQKRNEAEITNHPQHNPSPVQQISRTPEPAPSPSPLLPVSRVRPPSPERDYSLAHEISPTAPVVTESPDLSTVSTDAAYNEEGEWSDEFDDDVDEGTPAQHHLYQEPQPGETEDLYENVRYTAPAEENHNATSGQGICARAIYDYQAADDTEINFDPDDIITGIEMIDEGWWRGFGPNGHYGMFPSNYVELL
uniref:Drebrin-like a n=1 Tax=Neogobius melanostomus TaxID=47308 RepID=A0A8C6T7F8_9GOBI